MLTTTPFSPHVVFLSNGNLKRELFYVGNSTISELKSDNFMQEFMSTAKERQTNCTIRRVLKCDSIQDGYTSPRLLSPRGGS